MSGKNPSREMEDVDETVLNYAEVKAIATGNPLIKRKMELDLELQRLQILEAQYRSGKYSLENAVLKKYPQEIANYAKTLKNYEADITLRDKHASADFYMTLGKNTYNERKEAGELLLKIINSNQYNNQIVGTYKGFEVIPQEQSYIGETPKIYLRGTLTHSVGLSEDNVGSIMRIENYIDKLNAVYAEKTREYENLQHQFEAAKVQVTRPFEQEQELQSVLSELSQVNMDLDVDRSRDDNVVISDDEENADEMDENDDNKPTIVREDAEREYDDELEVG
jgi:hypothetical protein